MISKFKINPATICVAACLSAGIASPSLAEQVDVTLLLVSDIDNMEAGERGGFSRAAAVARAERKANKNLLYIHAGDSISPSLMSGIDMGEHIVDLLNMESPDVFVPGNHEFDFGPHTFEHIVLSELEATILSANLRHGHDKERIGVIDSKIYDFDGVKIGVFGITTPDTEFLSSPGDEYDFLPTIETAKSTTDELRAAGADLVVAVMHESIAIDEELHKEGFVDVILSGHDHELNLKYDGKSVLAETRSQAEYMLAVDLEIDVSERDGKRRIKWWPNFRIIDTKNQKPAKDIEARVAKLKEQLDEELGQPIGTTTTELDSRRDSVRGGENAFGNLMADAMRELTGADVAITNGGGIRADKEYPAGSELTSKDIFAELPFGNSVVELQLSGAQLREALENGLSKVEERAGRFPHVSGIELKADLNAPAGSRLREVKVHGKPLDNGARYTVATNDYMANGGDSYTSLTKGKVIKAAKDTKLLASAVIDYIAARGKISPKIEGRMKFD